MRGPQELVLRVRRCKSSLHLSIFSLKLKIDLLINLNLLKMEAFMIQYFEKCLDNKVNQYTLNWIENNYHRLPEERSWQVWQDYINHFAEKRFKSFWHDIIPYETIYEIYIEISFNENFAKTAASHIKEHNGKEWVCMEPRTKYLFSSSSTASFHQKRNLSNFQLLSYQLIFIFCI